MVGLKRTNLTKVYASNPNPKASHHNAIDLGNSKYVYCVKDYQTSLDNFVLCLLDFKNMQENEFPRLLFEKVVFVFLSHSVPKTLKRNSVVKFERRNDS